ncbi:hypothetical protein QAD02_014408 [Eretmocerus hayati]|uniref:Uncharacterized protein n=1 Tax=Eretmocerus hayati TaxID=131215 RepID=A0ACC2P591_9HYME|nr:hypothetical protein QAD02_014408 [Eretmocerus hayati]
MESCGEGGQRLPPDGDEFPAAYHEFVLGPMKSTNGSDVKRPAQSTATLHCLAPSRDAAPRTAAELLNDPEPDSRGPTMALPPPPLPSSAPPSATQSHQPQQPEQEYGGNCWRQDNRSERSVRDKIAMFTSQAAGLEAPLFPSPQPPTRRLSQPGPKTQPRSLVAPTITTTTPTVVGTTGNGLTRATSFSGLANGATEAGGYIARQQCLEKPQPLTRTNSLASTFARPVAASDESARRSSLSQLIEQRRKGISKLRGLVIPERDALTALSSTEQQPIVDLPEIRSRDSILNNLQVTRSKSLQQQHTDLGSKWGSQGSLSSSTRSFCIASSFKMPAPKILSSYSPAFKRKSLAVYGSSNGSSTTSSSPPPPQSPQSRPSSKQSSSSSSGGQQLASPDLAPKSLESICSPTRSDYSFEFAASPTLMLNCSSSPPNPGHHQNSTSSRLANGSGITVAMRSSNGSSAKSTTLCYHDDSDNDSAVSSSQSSISRGFSPPASPVPSDRSTLSSSERSYLSSCGETTSSFAAVQQQSSVKISQRQLQQQQLDQQQSLSRRVLKPQSVEAINRKNILASARCRSGRDQNVGSPLIQRKFDPDEEADDESSERHRTPPSSRVINGCNHRHPENGTDDNLVDGSNGKPQIKIAYIEIADEMPECEQPPPPPRLPPKRSLSSHPTCTPVPSTRLARVEAMEPSNDMKSWLRSEIRSLRSSTDGKPNSVETIGPVSSSHKFRSRSSLTLNESNTEKTENDHIDAIKPTTRLNLVGPNKSVDDHDDLLAVLSTKSRSRSAIHVEDTSYGKLKSQMSLEDMLGTNGSAMTSGCKLPRSQSVIESNGVSPFALAANGTTTITVMRDDRRHAYRRSDSMDSWHEDRATTFAASANKTTSFGRPGYSVSRIASGIDDELVLENGKLTNNGGTADSKIPMPRNLGRRSASVTDMKKIFEKAELSGHAASLSSTPSRPAQSQAGPVVEHSRFPSLDSSLSAEEGSSLGVSNGSNGSMGLRPSGSGSEIEHERFNSEQFGSISSLASSTSLISQQELAQLVEEANLEEPRGGHDVVVVLLHKENPAGGVGIILAGGSDCESKEISVHRVLSHSIADKEGSVQRGDRILSINGRSMRGLSHRESLAILKQPRSELVLVVSRPSGSGASSTRSEEAPLGCGPNPLAQHQHQHQRNSTYPARPQTTANNHEPHSADLALPGFEASNSLAGNTAWGPSVTVVMYKDGSGLGFSLEGGRDSPLGDRPLLIKKIFTGGAAEKTGALRAGDQLLEVNKHDVSRMSRIEAWSFMKKLADGEVNLLVRHPATKLS